ncbi:family 78 glycoside hydrolase catalytic domain [Enterococcus larvae]|uniref:family 78 glycoside hydrolase catalytic domain n=1 Tax=Enterococcus larvae TaxID=2794352 RepID=UPI003F2EDA85
MPITVDWREIVFQQHSYLIQITDKEGKLIFEEQKQTTEKIAVIDLKKKIIRSDRQTFFVHLVLNSINKEQWRISSQFTTASQGIQKADWITRLDNPIAKEGTYFRDNPTIILSKMIQLETPIKQAWIDLCGLGYYTLFVNDQRIGDDYLNNNISNYDKIVYYDTYEITKYLKIGENKIAVELGNGWYNPAPINILGKYNVRKQLAIGKPCLIAGIDLEDTEGENQQILTDATWESSEGMILMNNVFVGERVTDASFKKRESTAVKILGPSGVLTPGEIPKIRRVAECFPKNVFYGDSRVIVDFGEIISGQIAFTVSKAFIGKIALSYSERLVDEETLDYSSTISGTYGITDAALGIEPDQQIIQRDELVKTTEEAFRFSNQYTYHSFRYVAFVFREAVFFEEVIEELSAFRVHTNVDVITELETSIPMLNDLWRVGLQTRLNNIHSYFEDCTRERFGYGGDIVALIDSHMYSINGLALLKKVMTDFINDQTIQGGIPATAPFVGIMTNGPSDKAGAVDWQLVLPTITNKLLQFYDEKKFVKQYIPQLVKHIDYLLSFDFEYIKVCSLGDWGSIDEEVDGAVITSPDQEFCSACSYSIILQEYLAVMADLSETEQAERLSAKIEAVNKKIVTTYRQPNGYFGKGTQSSCVFALKANLLGDRGQEVIVNQLVRKINANNGIISVGIFGMSWIYEYLHKFGYKDVLFNWLTRKEQPSYSYMFVETGTLSEHFPLKGNDSTYNGSLNHAMFSSYSAWMVKQFLGISFPKGLFQKVIITPETELPIEKVCGSFKIPYGKIELQWTQFEELVVGEIRLPKNVSYEIDVSSKESMIEEQVREMGEYQEIVVKLRRT